MEFDALCAARAKKERRENYRAGIAPAVIANLFKAKGRMIEPLDFFEPRSHISQRKQTPEEMFSVIEGLTLAMGGKDLRKKQNGDSR